MRGGKMRGYQKKVVYLKNTGSSVFEEAYFVIKSNSQINERYTNKELIEEANRIIEENTKIYKGETKWLSIGNLIIFGIGFLSSALLSILFIMI